MDSNVKKTFSSRLSSLEPKLLTLLFSCFSCYMSTQRCPPVRRSGPWSASSPASAPWDWINPSGWRGNFSTPWPPWANPLLVRTPRCTWYGPSGPVWCVIQEQSCKEVQTFSECVIEHQESLFQALQAEEHTLYFWFIANSLHEPLFGLLCCSYIHQLKTWGPA